MTSLISAVVPVGQEDAFHLFIRNNPQFVLQEVTSAFRESPIKVFLHGEIGLDIGMVLGTLARELHRHLPGSNQINIDYRER